MRFSYVVEGLLSVQQRSAWFVPWRVFQGSCQVASMPEITVRLVWGAGRARYEEAVRQRWKRGDRFKMFWGRARDARPGHVVARHGAQQGAARPLRPAVRLALGGAARQVGQVRSPHAIYVWLSLGAPRAGEPRSSAGW